MIAIMIVRRHSSVKTEAAGVGFSATLAISGISGRLQPIGVARQMESFQTSELP
jgi:hypothetical protein